MVKCIACQTVDDYSSVLEKMGQYDFKLDLIKCNSCDLVFLKTLPSMELIEKMYNTDTFYNTDKSDDEEIKKRLGILDYAEKLSVRDSGKFLEVGCARGYL